MFQEEEKIKISNQVKDVKFPIKSTEIPPDLNQGLVRSLDHKMRELINILIESSRYSEAKTLIEKTVRQESYDGRKKKLEKILAEQGLDYNNI